MSCTDCRKDFSLEEECPYLHSCQPQLLSLLLQTGSTQGVRQSYEDTSYKERCWKSVQGINRVFKFLPRDSCYLSPTVDIFIFFVNNSGILPLMFVEPFTEQRL